MMPPECLITAGICPALRFSPFGGRGFDIKKAVVQRPLIKEDGAYSRCRVTVARQLPIPKRSIT